MSGVYFAMHALIIEDEPLIAALIEDCLCDLGYTSFAFAERECEAIAAAEEHLPALITADNRLIEGTGVDAVREICASFEVPVIFIGGDPDAIKGVFPNAVVIGKPFRPDELQTAVKDVRAPIEPR